MADDGPWLNVPQAVVLEVTRDIELLRGPECRDHTFARNKDELGARASYRNPARGNADAEQRLDAISKQERPCGPIAPIAGTWRHSSGSVGGSLRG